MSEIGCKEEQQGNRRIAHKNQAGLMLSSSVLRFLDIRVYCSFRQILTERFA